MTQVTLDPAQFDQLVGLITSLVQNVDHYALIVLVIAAMSVIGWLWPRR